MIPRGILKKIRQIEIRTNRVLTELAGERTRLGCGPTRLVSDICHATDLPSEAPDGTREGACAPHSTI
jgi:hypothetical protein